MLGLISRSFVHNSLAYTRISARRSSPACSYSCCMHTMFIRQRSSSGSVVSSPSPRAHYSSSTEARAQMSGSDNAGRPSDELRHTREMRLAKGPLSCHHMTHTRTAYYALSSSAGVFLFPYLALFLVDKGVTPLQLGLLCTLRPILGSVATLAGPMIADHFECHRAMLVTCFGVSSLLRSCMYFSSTLHVAVALLVAAEFLASPVGPFVDSHVQHRCKKESDYGKQRQWASIGWGATAPIAGFLIQRFGMGIGFLLYTVLSIPAVIITLLLDSGPTSKQEVLAATETAADSRSSEGKSFDSPAADADHAESHSLSASLLTSDESAGQQRGSRDLRQLAGSPAVRQLLLQCLASGIGMGMIGTYLFVFARDISAVATLMGLLLLANCAAEVPMFYYQEKVMRLLTPNAMMNTSLVAMVVRLLAYAAVGSQGFTPWLLVPIELLQGLTMAVFWSAACVTSKRLAPRGLGATMQGIVTATFGGLGGGLGGLLGGMLREQQHEWSSVWLCAAGVVGALWIASLAVPVFSQMRMRRKGYAGSGDDHVH